jgi:hypothetical protein
MLEIDKEGPSPCELDMERSIEEMIGLVDACTSTF